MQFNLGKKTHINKIAVLRAGSIGDFIISTPALEALRCAYPTAEIVLLGAPWMKTFDIEKRTAIDRLVIVPAMKGIRPIADEINNEGDTASFFAEMQHENFDLAISFHGNGISANPFLQQLKAKQTVGLKSDDAVGLDVNVPFYYYHNELVRYLEVANAAGAVVTQLEPHINVLPADRIEALPFITSVNKPFIVLHSQASDIRRSWPPEKFAMLADELIKSGYSVLLSGAEEDRQITAFITQQMEHQAVNVAGKLSLGGLAALMEEAALVIGSDTGPLHLARAVQAPTVGIYWAPNLINWAPLTRSVHRPVVSWKMECPLCGIIPNDPYPFEPKTDCDHAVSFVKDISVEQVMSAAKQLLEMQRPAQQLIPDIAA